MSDIMMSQSEFESLMDSDGVLRDQQEIEGEKEASLQKENEEEDKITDKEDETEKNLGEKEKSVKEDAPTSIDWEKLPQAARAAFEKANSEAQKWQKDYSKLQSKWTKESQSWKEKETTHAQLVERDAVLKQFEKILESNPDIYRSLQERVQKGNKPFSMQDIPDDLRSNPVVQLLENRILPYVQQLETKISQYEPKFQSLDQMTRESEEKQVRANIDAQINAGREQIAKLLGREATEDELQELIDWMNEERVIGDHRNPESFKRMGKMAAMEVFSERAEGVRAEKQQADLKEKAKKFPSRTKSVNPSRAVQERDARDFRDGIAMAMEEHGLN